MAFYREDEEDKFNQGAGQEQQAGMPVQASQGSGTISAGAPGAAAAGGSKKPDNPGNFAGIKTYLDANKKQASQLGDDAANVINKSAQEARGQVQGLQSSFDQAAGQKAELDEGLLSKIGQGAENLSQEERQKAKQKLNAQYSGPMDLMDQNLQGQFTQAQTALNKAKTNVEGSGTEEGRKSLITQINAKPRTQGITNFDNILLQSGTGREKLAQTAQANKDVSGDVLGQANTLAAQKAQENKAAADLVRAKSQEAVTGAQSALQKNFDPNDPTSRLAQQIQQALKANSKIAQDLGDDAYSLDQETMDLLGLTAGQRSFGIDPTQYFQQSDISQITPETVATAQEFARAQALAELTGGQSILDQSKASQAGTANQFMGRVDREKLAQDLAAKEKEFTSAGKRTLNDVLKGTEVGDEGMWRDFYADQLGSIDLPVIGKIMSQSAGVPEPKSKLETASPEQLQKEWLPGFEKMAKAGDPRGKLFADYIKRVLSPFKVTEQTNFKANKRKV